MSALMPAESGEVPGATLEGIFCDEEANCAAWDCTEKKQLLKYWGLFNLDKYYDSIKDYTFNTRFVKFKKDEGQAWLRMSRAAVLSDEDQSHLARLKRRLEKAANALACPRLFLKLSTRSAKDAVDKNPDKLLGALKHHLTANSSLNEQLVAVRRAFVELMGQQSIEEALDFFNNSARVISDVKRAIDFDEWDIHFVVREYLDIPVEGEFRAIVSKKQLTGLSQLYGECHFPNLLAHKDEIASKIQQFHRKVGGSLPFESYVMDLVVLADGTIKIVELNPFGVHTGVALFKWGEDKKQLEDGPFEFRVRTQPLENKAVAFMTSAWRPAIDKAMAEAVKDPADKQNCTIC